MQKKITVLLGSRLRELRGDASQSKFVDGLGFKQQTYASWETGRTQPSLEDLAHICLVFGVSSDWLVGLSDDPRGVVPAVVDQPTDLRAEVERLWSLVESQQRTIEALASGGAVHVASSSARSDSDGSSRKVG